MVRKRVEGNEKQRRKRAHQARRKGVSPSEAQVTTGASKEREHLPGGAPSEERQDSSERGKQGKNVDRGPSKR